MYFNPFGFHSGFTEMRQPQASSSDTRLYEILGLEKDANPAAIKKAYRTLAIKHHPDKGGDPEKFKEISRAYEVLSDPSKRKTYDDYGESGLEGGASDPTDLFDMIFGGGFGNSHRSHKKRKGDDTISTIHVSLEEVYKGGHNDYTLTRNTICTTCKGIGGPESANLKCPTCDGRGMRVVIRQSGPMIQQTHTVCQTCKGQGKSVAEDKKCKHCKGTGSVRSRKTFDIYIPKGIPDKHKIVFAGEADEKLNEIPGDAVFIASIKDHPVFRRQGENLYIDRKITLGEALLGFKFKLKHLDGRELLIESFPGEIIRPNAIKAVQDEGMPRFKDPFIRGHLFVNFEIIFPDDHSLSRDEIAQLRILFSTPEQPKIDVDSTQLERHTLVNLTPEESKSASQREAYDADQSDDEDGGRGGVQCRQQ